MDVVIGHGKFCIEMFIARMKPPGRMVEVFEEKAMCTKAVAYRAVCIVTEV